MQYTVLILLAAAAYYGWYYWNRQKNIEAAGGAEAFGQQLYRRQFGFADDENLTKYFTGQYYIGALRPDQGPDTFDKVVAAASLSTHRGAHLAFALSDKDRMAITQEQGDQTSMRDRLDAMKGEHLGMDAFAQFGVPKPQIRYAEEAFAGSSDLPNDRQRPELACMSGKVERLALIHIEPAGGAKPLTVWIDPQGAETLIAWSRG